MAKHAPYIAAAICLIAATSPAQGNQSPLLTDMLASPDNPVVVYAFVEEAQQTGDLGQAADALERLLRFRPEQTEARAALVEIYDAIGAPNLATAHAADLPADAPEKPSDIRGFIAVGGGWDSNPGGAPRDGTLRLFNSVSNQFERIDLGFREEASAFGYLQGGLRASTGDETRFVVDLSGAITHYASDGEIDYSNLSARAGPQFEVDTLRLRPFVDVEGELFDGRPYAGTFALGVEGAAPAGDGVLRFEAAGGYSDYQETPSNASRDELDGAFFETAMAFETSITDQTTLTIGGSLAGRDARAAHERRLEVGGEASLGFALSLGPDAPDALLTLGARATGYFFDSPDPGVDPTKSRRDLYLTGYVGLGAPLDDATTVDLSLSLRRRYSNLAINENEGLRASLRLLRRF